MNELTLFSLIVIAIIATILNALVFILTIRFLNAGIRFFKTSVAHNTAIRKAAATYFGGRQ